MREGEGWSQWRKLPGKQGRGYTECFLVISWPPWCLKHVSCEHYLVYELRQRHRFFNRTDRGHFSLTALCYVSGVDKRYHYRAGNYRQRPITNTGDSHDNFRKTAKYPSINRLSNTTSPSPLSLLPSHNNSPSSLFPLPSPSTPPLHQPFAFIVERTNVFKWASVNSCMSCMLMKTRHGMTMERFPVQEKTLHLRWRQQLTL